MDYTKHKSLTRPQGNGIYLHKFSDHPNNVRVKKIVCTFYGSFFWGGVFVLDVFCMIHLIIAFHFFERTQRRTCQNISLTLNIRCRGLICKPLHVDSKEEKKPEPWK